jgi:acyl-CoA synthetase (AMP-forming)/AMP-acid ligase II
MDATAPLLIGEIFRRNAEVVPRRTAASLGAEELSHAALEAAGNRVARALATRGIGRGDRVVCWSDTRLEVLPVFVALAKLGAVFAPLSALFGAAEARAVLAAARPALLLADAPHAAPARSLAESAGFRSLALGRLDGSEPESLYGGARSASPGPVAAEGLRESDPHVIFFTSGSTGRPKGVVLSHRASFLRSFQGVFRDEPERSVCMFPLFHMAAFTLALAAWQTRGEIALVASASAEAILEAVERRRANRLYCIPAVWHRILESDARRWDTSSLRELDTGTSATPIELIRALKARFPGTRTRIYYGSTEAGSATTLADADVLRKPGSVGPPSPGVDLRLAPDGEICVRSPYLMDGYFDDPEATAAVLRDGWFHTGDAGAFDEEGHLTIVGRLKDVIRSGGETIVPAEVEAVLAGHERVQEVAVIGLPDARWGELVCAVVVPRPGPPPALAELQAHCASRLAAFKKPRRLDLVDALPRTPATGQVQRALLVVQLSARPAGEA